MQSQSSFVLLAITVACATRPPANELTLKLDVKHALDTNVGRYWTATVRGVIAGQLPDRVVNLHTFPAHYPGDHFQCCGTEQGVVVRFERDTELPFAGFRAADGTYWRIAEIVGDRPLK